MTAEPIFIGLTGGIATGKSTVAAVFKERGAAVVSCDRIAHRLIQKGSPIYIKIISEFGRSVIGRDGDIDRRMLAQMVFNDARRRRRLEDILHPAIWREVLAAKQRAAALGKKVFVAEVPLLFEAGLDAFVDISILTFCPENEQIRRAMHSLNLTKKEALARIRSQMKLLKKLARADLVLDTGGPKLQSRARAGSLLDLVLMAERLFA